MAVMINGRYAEKIGEALRKTNNSAQQSLQLVRRELFEIRDLLSTAH